MCPSTMSPHRAERGDTYAPSFGGFAKELVEGFPKMGSDREFVALFLDGWRLETGSAISSF